jgi:hypothetical protein
VGGLCDGHLFGGAHGIEETKELLDPRNLERVVDALAHAYQRQIPSAMLAGNVCAYQRPDTGGIDVRDIREIDDQRSGGVGAYRGLELKHRGHHQGSIEAENALSGLRSGLIFNAEGLLRHRKILNPALRRIVNAVLIYIGQAEPGLDCDRMLTATRLYFNVDVHQ